MTIVKTEIVVVSLDTTYQIPGDWTSAQVVANYAASIQGLAAMQVEESIETRDEGQVKVLTFHPKVGGKG